MRILLGVLLGALLLAACESDDKPSQGQSYEIVAGDTLITIPATAAAFATERFELQAYLLREYQVARDPNLPRDGGSPFAGTLLEWKSLPWSVRQTFLIAPYTHDVLTDSLALYFYMIGTYGTQFGYGWRDTYDSEADLWNSALRPWLRPADSTLTPDNPGTLEFDGGLGDMIEYRGMWGFELLMEISRN
ncbi:hypothetical protein KJZ99_05005 [bacterium]|nr:hypothetical protein [bacterium]